MRREHARNMLERSRENRLSAHCARKPVERLFVHVRVRVVRGVLRRLYKLPRKIKSMLSKFSTCTSASNHEASSLSRSSPILPRHPRTIALTQPSVRRTMAGLASLRLIMNSSAALRTSSASSPSSSSSTGPPFGVGGNVKLCVPGKGLVTVGVGPESADGMISAERKESRACRCGANSCGWDVVRGVRMMRISGGGRGRAREGY